MESANRAVPKGTIYIGLQGAIQYIVYFLAYVALTRIRKPTEIGELPLRSAIQSVFSTITLFALDTATTKYVAEFAGAGTDKKVAGVASTALKIVAALSLPGFLMVALLSPQISALVFRTALNPQSAWDIEQVREWLEKVVGGSGCSP